jgi:hypothetical protein
MYFLATAMPLTRMSVYARLFALPARAPARSASVGGAHRPRRTKVGDIQGVVWFLFD